MNTFVKHVFVMVFGTKVILLSDRNAVETRPGVDKPLVLSEENGKLLAYPAQLTSVKSLRFMFTCTMGCGS